MPGKITPTLGSPAQRSLSRAEADRSVRADLTWDVGSPEEERRLGYDEGTRTVLDHMNDRAQLLRVLDALDRGEIEFLMAIRQADFIASTPAGHVRLDLLEAFLFGAASGGIRGPYGRAYIAAHRAVGPFVRSVH